MHVWRKEGFLCGESLESLGTVAAREDKQSGGEHCEVCDRRVDRNVFHVERPLDCWNAAVLFASVSSSSSFRNRKIEKTAKVDYIIFLSLINLFNLSLISLFSRPHRPN